MEKMILLENAAQMGALRDMVLRGLTSSHALAVFTADDSLPQYQAYRDVLRMFGIHNPAQKGT